MKKKFRLFGTGAATVGAMAGLAALTLPQAGMATAAITATPITSIASGAQATNLVNRPAQGLSSGDARDAEDTGGADAGNGPRKGWRPITHGLDDTPAELLPETISRSHPVRVVSTTVTSNGSPVITVRTATDATTATKLVHAAQQAQSVVGVELDSPVRVADAPAGADPLRYLQWDLTRIGTPRASSQSTGAGVTVAVVDTGVDATHTDLTGQVLPGGDFITGTEGQSIDPHGHGTHVAGTIAAIAGNNTGISGIAPDAKILPVRVLGANGGGYMSTAAQGVVYAADHGADVINLSLSSTTPTDAVAYARSKNVVVVAAAGNARAQGSPISYPAADDGVIAVAATDSADNPASYSNRGGYVDVAAPGSGIVSTYPTAKGDAYMRMNGTSMAAPHVAAVAALIRSRYRTLNPDQVEAALESSAVNLGAAGRDDIAGRRSSATGRSSSCASTTFPPAPRTGSSSRTAPTTEALPATSSGCRTNG